MTERWRRFHRTCFYTSWSLRHLARDIPPTCRTDCIWIQSRSRWRRSLSVFWTQLEFLKRNIYLTCLLPYISFHSSNDLNSTAVRKAKTCLRSFKVSSKSRASLSSLGFGMQLFSDPLSWKRVFVSLSRFTDSSANLLPTKGSALHRAVSSLQLCLCVCRTWTKHCCSCIHNEDRISCESPVIH